MVDFVFVYLDALLVSGFEFFKLALPLIFLYFLITKLRETWDEGSFLEILAAQKKTKRTMKIEN